MVRPFLEPAWIPVFFGFILTAASVALIPVLLFVDGVFAQAFVTLLSAAALAIVAFHMRPGPGEIDHLWPLLPRIAFVSLLPAAWMLLQILPLGIFGLGHPIWTSAGAALGTTQSSVISVDPGVTLMVLGRYAGFVALGLAVSILTIDRRRAEWTLFAILTATAVVALLMLGKSFIIGNQPQSAIWNGMLVSAPTIIAIGCVISIAAIVRAYERSETRRNGPPWSVIVGAVPGITMGGIVFVLCLLALIRIGHSHTIAATGGGLGMFAALALIRRLGFGMWGIAAIAIALIAITVAVFTEAGITRSGYFLLAFVDPAKSGFADLTARMLEDARWSGSGAGTFAELTQLYRDIDEVPAGLATGPSTAAVIAIELGRPMLIIIGIVVVVLAVILLRATIRRGRDSFFPAAGAASLWIMMISALGDLSLLMSAPAILATVVISLALAQSVGRSAHQ